MYTYKLQLDTNFTYNYVFLLSFLGNKMKLHQKRFYYKLFMLLQIECILKLRGHKIKQTNQITTCIVIYLMKIFYIPMNSPDTNNMWFC